MEDEERLYRPQEFAKTVGLTKRALRHYNEQGILMPAYVNEAGHKFYTKDSFFEAQRILSLRFLQFSLDEIREIQKKHSSIKESLQMQRRMMQEKAEQILAITNTIDDMEKAIDESGEIDWDVIFNAVKFAKYQMVHENMMEYYNVRANEYDEIYEGKGPASFPQKCYPADVAGIHEFTAEFGKGHIIDIGCSSGYWLKDYYNKCDCFTYFDQSPRMLELCKRRVHEYGLMSQSAFIEGDILNYRFEEFPRFDCAVAGFLIGHFTKVQEDYFFKLLRKILKPGSEILIIENTWTQKRARKQNKEDITTRKLNDGRTFEIYKRYFDESDLTNILHYYDLGVKNTFFGNTFNAIIGIV